MKNQKRRIFAFICIMTMIVTLCYTPTTFAATTKSFKTSGKTIVPIVKKGKDISKNTNAALKEAARLGKKGKIYTVKLPKGTYYISESLKIWSNTTLDATGCTIKTKKTGFNMIATGSSEDNRKATGYKRYTNISIKGGTWVNNKKNKSSSIRLCRGSNITLKNIDMSHGSEKHMVEMAAVDGVKIINCKFHDSDIKDSKEQCEAVQLDICANETAYSSIIYDGSPCKNIQIKGNTFENVSRGVGTHSMLLNNYIDNVSIEDNTFKNITQEAIACVNYINAKIENNKMENVGGGILFHFSKTSNDSVYTCIKNGKQAYNGQLITDAKSSIANNTIETKYHPLCDKNVGIELYGRNILQEMRGADGGIIPAADYYVEGVSIYNNRIIAAGYGINLNDAKNNKIISNTIIGDGYDNSDPQREQYNGIRISTGSTGNAINSNTISGIHQTGILLYDNASATTVNGNTISNCSAYGIRLNKNCSVTDSMKDNTIHGCPQGAILTGEKSGCTVANGISQNTIQ